MLRTFSQAVATAAWVAAFVSAPVRAGSVGELCALPTASLEAAASQFAGCADALKEVNKHAVATWYTDRETVESYTKKITDITAHCDASTRLTLVVYGLPNKDCDGGYSASGLNQNTEDYKKWVKLLADGVGQRKVLYVLEPDAVGLLAKRGCGTTAGYAENVKAALQILSQNPNADIYMDVGYWTLMSDTDAKAIATTVKELVKGGRLKGIALNTSNYRSNKQMSELCANFQKAYGDSTLNCIVDTSRNYNESPPSNEWCNANFGGVGQPPTAQTGFSNLDYFIWIKPPGESDGACDGAGHDSHAMKGPGAGKFFKQHFETLWNNGYFVKEKNHPVIGGGSSSPTQKPADQQTSTSQTPTTTTPTPITTTPSTETSNSPTSPTSSTPTPAPVTSTTPPPTTAVVAADTTTTTTSPPSISSVPAAQQYASPPSETPSAEVRESSVSTTPAPEASKPKKKKKTKAKCDSGLEPLPQAEADNSSAAASAVKPAALSTTEAEEAPATVAASANATEATKSVSLSSVVAESALAPITTGPSEDQASTKSHGSAGAGGLGGGAIAGMLAAAVVAVAAAGVAFRRRGEARRRANTIETPVERFAPITATTSRVQML